MIGKQRCASIGARVETGTEVPVEAAPRKLAIDISLFGKPWGTSAPWPRTSVRLQKRAHRAHKFCSNNNPGFQPWVLGGGREAETGAGREAETGGRPRGRDWGEAERARLGQAPGRDQLQKNRKTLFYKDLRS